jgi:hypothetical protein
VSRHHEGLRDCNVHIYVACMHFSVQEACKFKSSLPLIVPLLESGMSMHGAMMDNIMYWIKAIGRTQPSGG